MPSLVLQPGSPGYSVLGIEGVRCAARGRTRLQRTWRAAAAVVGPDVAVVKDDRATPPGPAELLALDAGDGDGVLGRGAVSRMRAALGPVLVVRGRPVLDGPMLVVDDGTAASLPALCAALAISSVRRQPVVLAGWHGDPDRDGQRTAALELFRRHGTATEPAAELMPAPGALDDVIVARGITLAIVGANDPVVGHRPAVTAACSVLVVR